MPSLAEDAWVNQQAVTHELSEIEDCAIAVDATYYIQYFLDSSPSHEPLLPALGGLTGFQSHIESDIDQWLANKVTPLFVFDGQTMIGQDEVSLVRGLRANERTNQAWELYRTGQAESAVSAFGANSGAFRPQSLYHLLQSILKSRNLHFLVAPCSAAAQVAYFDLIDSDQCGGIMGSQELLLYPIGDSVIRSIDWAAKTVTAISKKQIIKSLGVSEPMFIDALLMTGTSFLPVFPALQDGTVNPRQPTVMDAINMLRASDKSVATACASFNDILQAQDPNWLDKYRKARMAVNHFIHITEKGEVKVNELDRLTNDNHEYLGLQLPPELFHYLNTGLISPRVMSWITHCKILVLPTLDGVATPEYKQLISSQLVPVKEMTLGLLIPRLNRGIQHRDVTMRVWYDEKFTHSVNHRNLQPSPGQRAASWNVSDASIKAHVPSSASGSIAAEVAALKKPEFVKSTLAKGSKSTLDSADSIVSLSIWRLLHLRDYVNDEHELTAWGQALYKALTAIEPTVKKYSEVAGLNEAILVAFELLRFDLLNARNKHEELYGMPMNGSEEDIASLLLLSRCASLLKLRHQANGYTGPLSKNYLTYRSLVSAVREADRDLTESIVASMFMYGQTKRERDDNWQINDRLPFLRDPDVALSIAVKTLLDELPVDEAAEERAARIEAFPAKFVPFATHFVEDLNICYALFDAILAGVRSLDDKLVSAADKKVWEQTSKYLQARR